MRPFPSTISNPSTIFEGRAVRWRAPTTPCSSAPHACGAGRNGTAAAVTLGGRESRSNGSTSSRGRSYRPPPEGHKVEEVEGPLFFIRSGQDGEGLRALRQAQDEREKGTAAQDLQGLMSDGFGRSPTGANAAK
jgi:hypothetical protein